MWKHPYHRWNQEFEGWNMLLPQTTVLSCYAIAIGHKDSVGLSVFKVHISATRYGAFTPKLMLPAGN
jgi:hypothetical protein